MIPIESAQAPRTPIGQLGLRLQRQRALLALFDLGRRKGLALRAAWLYALGVFVSYAIAIALVGSADRRARIQDLIRSALVALSWVVGALAALGTAQILAQQAERDGLRALALQRGFCERDVLRARTLAGASRVARLLGIPALLLVFVALGRGQSLAWALTTAPAVLLYAVVLGLSVAVLAQFSAALAPRHPRALLTALVLGPSLLAQAYPALPSVAGAFAALLDRLLEAGATLT